MAQKTQAKACRVCLSSDRIGNKKGISIFQQYKDFLISDQINAIANVEIKKNDGLPKLICPDCLLELEAAVNFKQKCENSDVILHTKELDEEEYEIKIEYDVKEEVLEEEVDIPLEPEYLEEDSNDVDDSIDKIEEPNNELLINSHLTCDDCGGSFASKCKMRVHWKRVHMPEKLICQICKRTFKTYKAFNRHIKNNPKACFTMKNVRVQGLGKSRVYLCNDCPYSSKRNKDMQCHLLTHTGERPAKCLRCDKQFTQLSSMHAHMEQAHGVYKVEITCQYCGKFVRGRHKVYKHLMRHKTAGAECDVCKKIFSCKKSLSLHMIRHTGVKSYTCEKCAKRFFTLSELCNHKRLFHGGTDVWYKCGICEYKTRRAATTKRHQAKHTETNAACPECGKFVENSEKLAQHQRRHSETEKKFACPFCDKKFFRRDSVPKHIKSKHKCTMFVNKPVLVKNEHNTDESNVKTVCIRKGGTITYVQSQ